MLETRKDTNYLMDFSKREDRINYFRNLRGFLSELHEAASLHEYCSLNDEDDPCAFSADDVLTIFKKWNVYLIDADEIPRVNLDEPTK